MKLSNILKYLNTNNLNYIIQHPQIPPNPFFIQPESKSNIQKLLSQNIDIYKYLLIKIKIYRKINNIQKYKYITISLHNTTQQQYPIYDMKSIIAYLTSEQIQSILLHPIIFQKKITKL